VTILLLVGYLHWTIIFIPFVILPLVIFTLGLSFILAALGVYLRDIAQVIGILTSILMFLTPIFYPLIAVPEKFRPIILANPLTFIIEQAREVLIFGHAPNWSELAIYTIIALLVVWTGFAMFQRIRKGFADVL
jgi:lipopolysaccharide transport system permease protein